MTEDRKDSTLFRFVFQEKKGLLCNHVVIDFDFMHKSSYKVRWIARIASSILAIGGVWGISSCCAKKSTNTKTPTPEQKEVIGAGDEYNNIESLDSLDIHRPRLMYGVPNVTFSPKVTTEDKKDSNI